MEGSSFGFEDLRAELGDARGSSGGSRLVGFLFSFVGRCRGEGDSGWLGVGRRGEEVGDGRLEGRRRRVLASREGRCSIRHYVSK